MSALFALALVVASANCDIPAAEQKRQLALPYEAFDSVPEPYGWRAFNGRGCVNAAVTLLEAYRSANAAKLTAEERREMPFHIGQAYAFNGRDRDAAPWFGRADAPDAPEEWRAYVAAHVAFFGNDRPALEKARARYLAASKPGSMRLKVIDGLLACMGKSYMAAAHCAM
jgi:hypothetical protein